MLPVSCKIWVLLEYVAGKFAPGVYTLAVSEALPEEMQVGIFLFVWYRIRLHNILLMIDFVIYYDAFKGGFIASSFLYRIWQLSNNYFVTSSRHIIYWPLELAPLLRASLLKSSFNVGTEEEDVVATKMNAHDNR